MTDTSSIEGVGTKIAFVLTRDVPVSECPWLDRDMKAGETVFDFTGCTYGCVGPDGIACSERPGEHPFFEIPRSALTLARTGNDGAA